MSQRLEILRFLAQGKRITPLVAFRKFNCLTLSQRIAELRREGWPVHAEMVETHGKRVAEYSLPPGHTP